MSTELIINASLPETRIALMENGEIQDLVIERPSDKGVAGNIYKGRVTRVLPGMQAAFVDIGLEKAAFLYVDDVYVHSEIWEDEEGESQPESPVTESVIIPVVAEGAAPAGEVRADAPAETQSSDPAAPPAEAPLGDLKSDEDAAKEFLDEDSAHDHDHDDDADEEEDDDDDLIPGDEDEEDEDDDDDRGPVPMGSEDEKPAGTVAPEAPRENTSERQVVSNEAPRQDTAQAGADAGAGGPDQGADQGESSSAAGEGDEQGGGRHRRGRRGRRGGRHRRRERGPGTQPGQPGQNAAAAEGENQDYPENYVEQVAETGETFDSDRSALGGVAEGAAVAPATTDRPTEAKPQVGPAVVVGATGAAQNRRPEFREQRSRDRRIRPRQTRSVRGQVNIQDLLKEGQEVLVQVAKEPIATKGARLTCHISLPGRHLVCMPTIDHVGVSRRIERDDERRKLREHVERYRPKNLGFIVRTASGRQQAEKRIKQDIDYLARLWGEIREKAGSVTAPALVYEDLNPILRAIRDWVTEDIDRIVVDSRYHFNEIQRFVSHFMPSLKQKIELYQGDLPVFDMFGISTELSRALERKVWLKSGGYLVIDQAEALVAIDVNTGRFVGKKNLEDTILKTNLEAVEEIAYQLRLRNAGGIIILDLIDMEKEENKQRVYRALEEALKKDRARPSIMKISDLGLVEMTRKRTRDTMVRTLCESCSVCEGKGYIKSKQTVVYEILRELEREGVDRDIGKVLVQAHPEVIDGLAIDERETLDHMERRYRKQVYLQAAPDFHMEQFEVVGDKGPRTERGREHGEQRDQRDGRRGGRDRDRGRGRDRDRNRDKERDRDREDQRFGKTPAVQQPREGTLPVIRPVIQPVIQPVQQPVAPQGEGAGAQSGAQPGGEGQPQISTTPVPQEGQVAAGAAGPEHDMTEEDRLAFLRAQAAQDAALAKYHGGANAAGPGGLPTRAPRQPQQGGGRGGDRDRDARRRRGRRGGRFRNDNRKPRSFGPQGPGVGGPSEGGTPGPVSGGPSGGSGPVGGAPVGGGGGGPVGGGSGPGDDHSQPSS